MRIEDLKGFVDFPGGLRLLDEKPIDARYVGEDLDFLQSIVDIGAAYPGLSVFIISENKTYKYKKNEAGIYGFYLETVSFTQEEEAALDSGITKEKVREFEGKYSIPPTGIPEADLSDEVKAKLEKAETALQGESDPTVPQWAKEPDKPSYTIDEIPGLRTELNDKVKKEEGKGLSEENFTSGDRAKLAGVQGGAQVNVIESFSINGTEVQPVSKKIEIPLKTINEKKLNESGDIKLVETDSDQNIGGYKTFENSPVVPSKSEIDLNSPKSTSLATEAQVAKAIELLGDPLTRKSPLSAENLTGNIPNSVGFPTLNQNTTGNAGSADKLKTKRRISISGKAVATGELFDGSTDIQIEVEALSQNKDDYPVLNQNTTGNAGSADKLKTPRTLRVNLGRSTESVFDGSANQDEIPVKGRIGADNLLQGQGTGVKRKVLATGRSVATANLGVTELEPQDVGLDQVTNDKQATKEEFDALAAKVSRLESLGNFVGSYDTFDDLPDNVSQIKDKYGLTATENDFATVRGGIYPVGSSIPEGSATCWSITKIYADGSIDWAYEYTYNFDMSGKMDKVTGDNLVGKLPVLTQDGSLENSGLTPDDFIKGDDKLDPADQYSPTYKQKIRASLVESDTISGARKLIHPNTSTPCTHGSEQSPTYFDDGTPWPASKVPSIKKESSNRVVRLEYVEDEANPGRFLPTGEEIDDISVKHSDESSVSDFAKKFKAGGTEDNPVAIGSEHKPVYIGPDGTPTPIKHLLGDLAFEDIQDPENVVNYSGATRGSFQVYYDSTKTGPERFGIFFLSEKESSPTFYGLILPTGVYNPDTKSGLTENEKTNLKEAIRSYLTDDTELEIPFLAAEPSGESFVTSIEYGTGSGKHKINGIPKVRIFEITDLKFDLNGQVETSALLGGLKLFENYGMYHLEKASTAANHVVVTSNAEPSYDRLDGKAVAQGIYLVEISK